MDGSLGRQEAASAALLPEVPREQPERVEREQRSLWWVRRADARARVLRRRPDGRAGRRRGARRRSAREAEEHEREAEYERTELVVAPRRRRRRRAACATRPRSAHVTTRLWSWRRYATRRKTLLQIDTTYEHQIRFLCQSIWNLAEVAGFPTGVNPLVRCVGGGGVRYCQI